MFGFMANKRSIYAYGLSSSHIKKSILIIEPDLEMMEEHRLYVAYITIMSWVHQYGP
ncbi:hypothetical protein [Bacillus sp. OTU530]|uniref:hypothetical protein n=1 Tax=Bacillus sp. OTU530 TaxID=3043862 RepID=UPI00406BE47D